MSLPLVFPRRSPQHRAWQIGGYALIAALVLLVSFTQPSYQLLNFSKVAAYAVAILGINIVTGYSGQVSLGHSAFFGLGAYTTAYLVADKDWPFLATIPVAAALGLLVGFLVGLPALRIQGLYLALVTLAIAAVFPVVLKMDALSDITGGSNGKPVSIDWQKPGWFSLDVSNEGWEFLVCAAIAGLLFLLASNMIRSRVGRAIVAVRDNPIGAVTSGVSLSLWKTGAFSVSAAYGAVGGSLFMLVIPIVSPDSVGFGLAFQLITGLVLGGLASMSGSLIGGLTMVFLPYYSAQWSGDKSFLFFDPVDSGLLANVLYGALLIAAMFVMPGGIVSFVRSLRSRLIRFDPQPPTMPSPQGDEPPVNAVLAGSAGPTEAKGTA
ncbi:MAG: branched-chain amino acid ABC transporter permease [Acidimicrobiales bacterium]|nr:branched-chain amino acid ABC transporter permease [Acidimicrobiales bacterium]